MIPDDEPTTRNRKTFWREALLGRRRLFALAVISQIVAAVCLSAPVKSPAATEVLSICLIGSGSHQATQEADALTALSEYFRSRSLECRVELIAEDGNAPGLAAALRESDVAVIWVHGQRLELSQRDLLRKYSDHGGGLVIVGAGQGAWYDWAQFGPDFLDARFGDLFANGMSMRIINLFPHAIFTGVDHFDTRQAMNRIDLGPTAQVIMEGTVGEDTVPMAWVRRVGVVRVVAFTCGDRRLGNNRDFRLMLENSVRWAAGRRIPGAQTLVERTVMADAIPGALAICFPGGPSLCYDTVRGGIDYIWDGDFVDLHPWWTARHGQPLRAFEARIWGDIFYRDKDMALAEHVGTKDEQSIYHFRGYRLEGDGFPRIFYSVGDRDITEDLAAAGDGKGVLRTFHVTAGTAPLWLRIDSHSAAEVIAQGATRVGDYVHFDSEAAGEFTITIRRGGTSSP